MASASQAIANQGVREPTSLVKTPELRPEAEPVEVASPETAAIVKDLMIEVVRSGTGRRGPGAGRGGRRVRPAPPSSGRRPLEPGQTLDPGEDPPQEENAWFTAFAPADKPQLAVAAVVFDATGGGGGGAVAAPIVQQVLASAAVG